MAQSKVESPISGAVWKIVVGPGDRVEEGDTLVVLESMKMEIPVTAPRSGTVGEIGVAEGGTIGEGETVAILDV